MIRKGDVYQIRNRTRDNIPLQWRRYLVLSGEQANRETGHIVVAPMIPGGAKLFDGNITRPEVEFQGHLHHVCLDRARNAEENTLRHGLGHLPYAEMAKVEAALCRIMEL